MHYWFDSFYEEVAGSSYFIRWLLYQPYYFFKNSKISRRSRIGKSVNLSGSIINNYCYIGQNCIINDTVIGNYCSIAAGVQIGGMEHSWRWGSTSPRLSNKHVDNLKTVIEDDVWIGANTVIKRGVQIKRGAVVGACSLVLNDIPAFSVVAGIPTKIIRNRFSDKIVEQIVKSNYWLYPPKIARILLREIDYQEYTT